jgi:hypothetical protein
VFYGILFVSMAQAVFNETFYTNVNLLLKTAVLLALLYAVCRPRNVVDGKVLA